MMGLPPAFLLGASVGIIAGVVFGVAIMVLTFFGVLPVYHVG